MSADKIPDKAGVLTKQDLITLLHTVRRLRHIKPKQGYARMQTIISTEHTCDAGGEPEVLYYLDDEHLSMLIRGLEALP